jgi:hypothetical protein
MCTMRGTVILITSSDKSTSIILAIESNNNSDHGIISEKYVLRIDTNSEFDHGLKDSRGVFRREEQTVRRTQYTETSHKKQLELE